MNYNLSLLSSPFFTEEKFRFFIKGDNDQFNKCEILTKPSQNENIRQVELDRHERGGKCLESFRWKTRKIGMISQTQVGK